MQIIYECNVTSNVLLTGRGGPSNLIKGGFQADDTESAIDKFLSIPDKTITVKFIVCYLLIGLKKITHQ